jgi:hypothetical protein
LLRETWERLVKIGQWAAMQAAGQKFIGCFELSDLFKKILSLMDMIKDIAAQTCILSIIAGIEDMGRITDEVRFSMIEQKQATESFNDSLQKLRGNAG